MGKTNKGWTPETLEIYLSSKISAVRELTDQRHEDAEKAIESALQSLDKRLEGMNEFRATLTDQRLADEKHRSENQGTFITKEVYGLERNTLETVINKNADRIAEIDKKLFALSELKADKREGLSSKYMVSAVLIAGLSFMASVAGILWNVANHLPNHIGP
jgi:hypothetical protein